MLANWRIGVPHLLGTTEVKRWSQTVIPDSGMGSGFSGHPLAHYRGHCSKDCPPEDHQVRRDEHPEMNSTQTASQTEHPEPVVALQ